MFTMPAYKISEVASIARTDNETVNRVALEYDWSNDEDHQSWLNTAPAAEIAVWLADILFAEAQEPGSDADSMKIKSLDDAASYARKQLRDFIADGKVHAKQAIGIASVDPRYHNAGAEANA